VLLTSHYVADVETLCRRVLLIDQGALRYDGDLAGLVARLAPWKLIKVALPNGDADWPRFGEVVSAEGGKATLRVPRDDVPGVTARLLAELPVADLAVEEAPLESVIDRAYREGVGAPS
jgi:ABC-type uncharacterized transport system ATPase subunit